MMETSSTLNLNRNMLELFINSNYLPLSMINPQLHIKIKTHHSKSYKNPKKLNINTNDSSLINNPLLKSKNKSKHPKSLLIQDSFHYTPPNS